MPARISSGCEADRSPSSIVDSGYVSGSSGQDSTPEIYFTTPHLIFLNRQLQYLEPQGILIRPPLSNEPVANIRSLFAEILQWAITTLPSLFQTTSFGLTGLVTIDMLSKLKVPRPQVVDLIFFNTLHHFPETLALIDRVRKRYHHLNIHVYKPEGVETAEAFTQKHGENLWETNDTLYDWVSKVEPAQRAYQELQVHAILTGRRRSQGGKRGDLRVLDVDEAGLIKINPLANWTFQQVRDYVKDHNVPYNELLDRGYNSVGDWHSTKPITDGEDERAGRWQGKSKTECGIHNPRSRFAHFLKEQENKNKT